MRLRVQVQASGDKASAAYSLRYQKNGSGGYVAVPVGANTSPTLSYGAAGTIAYSASGGTSVAPAYPSGIDTNSELVLVIGQKPSSANGGTVTTPTGWTLRGSLTGANDGNTGGYTTTLGADTGNCNIFVYTKDSVSGSESGTLSVTVGTNNVCWGQIIRVQKSAAGTAAWACGTGKDTSAGSVSIATGAMAVASGDFVIGGMVIPTDVSTPSQFSAEAFAQTGTTFGSATEISEPDSGTGNDIGGFLCYAAATAGSGSGAVTLSATAGGTTTNVRGPGFVLRARASGVANEVYVATSANVTAGGEATTQQLTAGSGSFTTGRMWDNENGSDSIDIGDDGYTELEWNLATQAPAAVDDYFDFRVYADSSPLDTYTQTPRWTIGAGVQTYNVSLSESAAATDALSSVGTFARALSEAVTPSDTAAALGVFARTLAESVAPADSVGGGSAFAGSLGESVAPSDSMALAFITNPGLAESLTALDTVASALQGVAALTEAVAATDAPTAAKVTNPSLTEAVSATDSLAGGLALLAALSESAPVADVLASVQQAVAALAESLTVLDSIDADQQGVISVSMSESMAVADAVGSALTALAGLTETVTLTDQVVRNWITTAGLAETVAPSDVLTASRAIAAALSETAALVDSLGAIGVFSVQITEAAALIDAPQAAALLSAALSEAITPDDIFAAIAASYPGDPRRTFTLSGGRGLVVQAGDRVVVVTRKDRTIH